MFPDKSSKNFRFFNITGINYDKADKTSFSLVYKKGKAELIKDGKRIVTKQGDLYRIENSEILTDLAPVKFRIYGPGILKSVDLNIKLPVDVNYFISRDFKILENNSTITIDDLYDYKFVTDGKSQKRGITISLFEVDAEGEHKEMAERRISGLRPGTYNLDFFKDTFMKFYSIFGFNDWKYYLRLKSGGRMINIVRHRFRSDQYDSPERNGVKITDKGTPVSGLTLSAIILNCNRSSELYGQIIGMKEDLNNEGVYHPDTESLKADDCGSSAFLVFSTEKNSLVRPYALYLYDELNVEQRNKLKRESIEKIGRLLRYEDCDPEEYEQEWHDVKLCTE